MFLGLTSSCHEQYWGNTTSTVITPGLIALAIVAAAGMGTSGPLPHAKFHTRCDLVKVGDPTCASNQKKCGDCTSGTLHARPTPTRAAAVGVSSRHPMHRRCMTSLLLEDAFL